MNALDALLARIDADLALPAFPPLELAGVCPPRPPERQMPAAKLPPADQSWLQVTPEPRTPWWKRVLRRG